MATWKKEVQKKSHMSKRAFMLVVASVVIAAGVIGIGVYFLNISSKKEIITGSDYSELDGPSAREQYQKDTGQNLQEIETLPIDDSTFETSDEALVAARALEAVGSSKKSLEAYEQANRLSNDAISFDRYVSMAMTADSAGNTELGTEYMQKALEAMRRDGFTKQEIDNYQAKIDIRKSEQ